MASDPEDHIMCPSGYWFGLDCTCEVMCEEQGDWRRPCAGGSAVGSSDGDEVVRSREGKTLRLCARPEDGWRLTDDE